MAAEPFWDSSMGHTPLAALWRFRWLVLATTVLGAFLALMVAVGLSSTRYQATASLVVTDPRASTLFSAAEAARQSADLYLADQIAIMSSDSVAQRATELIQAANPGATVDANDIAEDLEIRGTQSNEIRVRYAAANEITAITTVNSVIEAYELIRGEAAARDSASAIAQLEQSIADIDAELSAIESRIVAVRSDPVQQQLDDQYQDLLARLAALQPQLATATDETAVALQAELEEIDHQLETLSTVILIEGDKDNPRLAQLYGEQAQAIARRSALAEQRDRLLVDTELLSGGITLSSPARFARKLSTAVSTIAILGAFLGLLAGSSLAYVLADRRRRIGDVSLPGWALGTPLLAEVPNFLQEGIASEVPVLSHPESATAEAFRFAATTLDLQLARGAEEGAPFDSLHSFLVTSASPGDGKTVLAANLALAAAREGRTVLAIDADFGNQRLTELLRGNDGGGEPGPGITEVVEAGLDLPSALVQVGPSATLDLLSRGSRPTTAPDFFNLPATRALFEKIANVYDMVLIDGPPMLHVAYASTLARYVDRLVVVVHHGSQAKRLTDLAQRLDLIGTPLAGYVYNAAPLRPEMTLVEGSLKDVLGRPHPTGSADKSDAEEAREPESDEAAQAPTA